MERTTVHTQTSRQQQQPTSIHHVRRKSDPFSRAQRHASRAGTTYARFVAAVAAAGGYSAADAEEYTVAVIATLEERLPLGDVYNLEAQLPSLLHDALAHEPILDLPTMNKALFCSRVATRLAVSREEAETIASVVFTVLRSRISAGESRRVESRLSPDLKDLWIGPQDFDL